MSPQPCRRHAGFTLLELMTVMVIVGVIAAIAYPSYKDYVTRSRRTEGKSALMQNMQLFEQYYGKTNSYYKAGTKQLWNGFNQWSAAGANDSSYRILAVECGSKDGQCVELQAEPVATRPDPTCGTLIYRSTGEKFVSLGNAAPTQVPSCW